MIEASDRWPLGSGKRIAHGLVCILAFELLHLVSLGFAFAVLGLSLDDLWTGDARVIAMTVVSGVVGAGGLVWLGVVRLGRVSWRDLGWHADRLGQSLGLAMVGLILLLAVVLGPLAVMGVLARIDLPATLLSYTLEQRLLFLVIGASAAIVEESLFRGYLQPALVAKTNLVGGIVIGGVVFSLYHIFLVGLNPLNLFGKFLLGLIFGALRGRDRSLVAPMVAHFLFWQVLGSL